MANYYNKDPNVNYTTLIEEAVKAGDYAKAALYEQSRNAKIQDLDATGTNKWGATQSTDYAQYLGNGYQAKGTYNDAGLPSDVAATVAQAKEIYNKGASLGDKSMMEAAHQMAEQARASAGYSGGADGSDYILLNNTPTPTGGLTLPTFDYNVARPTYNSQYDTKIDQMLNDLLNREDFSYNVENDQLYQQYATQYNREGNRAMNDALAAAASQAGGMNSYAMTAAQQANNYYSAQLNDKIPELYQLAYEMYLNDIDQQVRDLGLLQDMDNNQYNRYRDTMSDWYNDRDFAYGMYRDDMGDYHWKTEFDYGVSQDSIYNKYRQDQFDYAKEQDKISNDLAYGQLTGTLPSTGQSTLGKQEFDYGKDRDEVADGRYASDVAWDKAVTILNSGAMPDKAMLDAAGMTEAQAAAILGYVKLGYDKSLERGDYAPKVETASGGGGGGGGGKHDVDGPKLTTKDENNKVNLDENEGGSVSARAKEIAESLSLMTSQMGSKEAIANSIAVSVDMENLSDVDARWLFREFGYDPDEWLD